MKNKSIIIILAILILSLSACSNNSVNKNAQQNKSGLQFNSIKYIRMINESNGFIVNSSGVYKTSDGGANWQAITPPKLSLQEESFIYALDANNIWVTGYSPEPTIYISKDGGKNWSSSKLQGIGEVVFSDTSKGWILNRNGGTTPEKELFTLWGTEDGGSTWTKVISSVGIAAPGGTQTGNFPLKAINTVINFKNSLQDWTKTMPTGIADGVVLITKDSGKTWTFDKAPSNNPLASFIYVCLPTIFPDGSAVLPLSLHLSSSACVDFYTVKSGETTWSPTSLLNLKLPADNRYATSEGRDIDYVYSFADKNNGFVCDNNNIYSTTDGGVTWKTVNSPSNLTDALKTYRVKMMSFISNKTGWMLMVNPVDSTSRLFKTQDGGSSWTEQK